MVEARKRAGAGMAYHCKHCGTVFSQEGGRPRCPSCMRMTTIVEVADPPPASQEGRGAPGALNADAGGDPGHAGAPRRSEGLSRPPWPLWVGVAVLGATTVAVFTTSFGALEQGEGLGAAAAYAALGGAGFALAVRGFIKWRPWK